MEDLPLEPVAAVLDRLPFAARVVAHAVCKRWKGLADDGFASVRRRGAFGTPAQVTGVVLCALISLLESISTVETSLGC